MRVSSAGRRAEGPSRVTMPRAVPGPGPAVQPRAARLALLVVVALLAVGAAFLRQEGVPKVHTIWAEDATVFVPCAWERAPLDCLLTPYQGYVHAAPHLAAAVVVPGDLAGLPFRLLLGAALVAATVAVLVARSVADATGSLVAGLIAGAGTALVHGAGVGVAGSLTNLHILLAAGASVVVCMTWLGRRPGYADLLLVALAAGSSPYAPVLPLLALGGVLRRTPRARLLLAIAAGVTALQAVVVVTAVRVPPFDDPVTLPGLWAWAVDAIRFGVYGPAPWTWKVVPIGLAGLLVAGLAAAAWRDRIMRPAFLCVAGLLAAGAAMLLVSVVANRSYSYRYAYPLAVCAVAAVAVAAAALGGRWRGPHGRELLPALVGLVLLVPALLTFRVDAGASWGPDVIAQLPRARAACVAGAASVEIRISLLLPTGAYRMPTPCRVVLAGG